MDTTADGPISVANDNGSVTVEPGADNVKVVTTFVDETGQPQTVVTEKQPDGTWTITDGDKGGVTIDPVTGLVTIPADKVKDSSTVTSTGTDEAGNTATVTTVAKANPVVPVSPIAPRLSATAVSGRRLPNAGDATNTAAIAGTGLLFGAAFFARCKKREEAAEDEM